MLLTSCQLSMILTRDPSWLEKKMGVKKSKKQKKSKYKRPFRLVKKSLRKNNGHKK